MGRKRQLNIGFPVGGLNRKESFRQQPPFTTPDARNVRLGGTILGRDRGGSRPGLIFSHETDIGSNPRLLYSMLISHGTDFTAWSDTFGGTAVSGDWAQSSWASDSPLVSDALLYVDTSISAGALTRTALPIDSSQAYSVEMLLVPYGGSFAGKYQIYARMDNTTPVYTTDGIEVEVIMSGDTGAYTGTLDSYASSVKTSYALTSGTITGGARPVWLKVGISGNTITVTLDGTTIKSQAVSAHAGLRVGCGLEATLAGGVSQASVFRVQYYTTGTAPAIRSMLVASAGGNLYKETNYGTLAQVSSNLNLRSDVPLQATQSGQKLYIADYGDLKANGTNGVISNSPTSRLDSASYADWTTLGLDIYNYVVVITAGTGNVVNGTYTISAIGADYITLGSNVGDGNCSFRIERGPKIYDPIANTLTLFTAESGAGLQVPTGCPHICNYLDRITLAGHDTAPGGWYMARRSDEDDWDYSQTDATRAMVGTNSDGGTPGFPITALAAYSDDYLIMGCRHQMWRLRGDPAYGGSLDNVSYTIGIVGGTAWCFGPSGEFIFLSSDGVYVLPPGGDTHPVPISREVLPAELRNFNPDTDQAILIYDVDNQGVLIFVTDSTTSTRLHWFLDWGTKTFWPETLTGDHEPTAVCQMQSTAVEDSGVILAGRDGKLRTYSAHAEDDTGTTFSSYVDIGPIPLAADDRNGVILSMSGVVAATSGDVTYGVYPSLTFEGAAQATSTNFTGTWSAGHNSTAHPGGRGQAFKLKLTGTAGRRWAVEQMTVIIKESGPRRKF